MTAMIIDGRKIADEIQENIRIEVAEFVKKNHYAPKLGVILAGEDPASQMYVQMKRRACERVGIESVSHIVGADTSQAEVEALVEALNEDERVHGILVQLPLPAQLDEEAILAKVALDKDVDGFHPINIGKLAQKDREPTFTPATPTGCMVLLEKAGVNLAGANAVVVGRSNIVGMPMALLLTKANATVTICHSRTRDLKAYLKDADVVIAAIGRPNFVKGEWLKEGAVVIDVGTNKVDDPNSERGYRWVGDVDYEGAVERVRAITKVPGGVGPMTIAMLLSNTMKAARNHVKEAAK
ncbi:bifunctional methylenetetrahydrofolate dehydrogenase/methenyltetrahydrofolate cyclohydrolase FolD [Anaerolineales bacterium]